MLLGLFSMYTGFIYNDWFSKSLSITSSYYVNVKTSEELYAEHFITLEPSGKYRSPYMFGVDPAWTVIRIKYLYQYLVRLMTWCLGGRVVGALTKWNGINS